jgi:hypothetical protein
MANSLANRKSAIAGSKSSAAESAARPIKKLDVDRVNYVGIHFRVPRAF